MQKGVGGITKFMVLKKFWKVLVFTKKFRTQSPKFFQQTSVSGIAEISGILIICQLVETSYAE